MRSLVLPTTELHAEFVDCLDDWGPGLHEDGFGIGEEDDRRERSCRARGWLNGCPRVWVVAPHLVLHEFAQGPQRSWSPSIQLHAAQPDTAQIAAVCQRPRRRNISYHAYSACPYPALRIQDFEQPQQVETSNETGFGPSNMEARWGQSLAATGPRPW